MRHVVLVSLEYPPDVGGVASHLHSFFSGELPNWRCTVIAPLAVDEDQKNIVRMPFFYRRFWPRWLRLYFALRRLLPQLQADVVIAGQVLPVGVAVAMAARSCRLPYALMVYGMDVLLPKRSWRKQRLAFWVMRGAQRIIANSQHTAQLVHHFLPAAKVSVVYPACPDAGQLPPEEQKIIKAQFDLDTERLRVLFVGRLVARKGVGQLFHAWKIVQAQQPAELLLVGDGQERSALQNLAKDLGVATSVRFLGKLSDHERNACYAAAQLFVTTQLPPTDDDVEGFGVVFLEAAAHGLPVIAGNNGGAPEAVVDGVTGYLVDSAQPEIIAEKILFLLQHPDQARQMGNAGKNRVAKDFFVEQARLRLAVELNGILTADSR